MQATDQTAPTLPASSAPSIARGYAAGGCSGSSSSCADIGIVSVFPEAMDDMTPPEKIGFRITLAAGTLPAGLTLPSDVIDLAPNSALQLTWVDGATNDQEIINFTLTVVAVDLAGNESTPQTVVVQDDGAGSGGGGCRLSSRRAPGPAAILLAVFAVALAARRRRGDRT
jgi:hypothetical protein